jgi:hypothetical protein
MLAVQQADRSGPRPPPQNQRSSTFAEALVEEGQANTNVKLLVQVDLCGSRASGCPQTGVGLCEIGQRCMNLPDVGQQED